MLNRNGALMPSYLHLIRHRKQLIEAAALLIFPLLSIILSTFH